MTERDVDAMKNELVRALRRKAAELDATDGRNDLATMGPRVRPGTVYRSDRENVAFFARQTFRLAVADSLVAAGGH